MKRIQNPRQKECFDFFELILSKVALRRLQSSWHFLFRQVILELLPASELGEHFDPELGRPTKELFSMAGLLLIKEFKNWTIAEAADSYMFDVATQYALNLRPDNQSICERTIERYQKLFREDDLANEVMTRVTGRLVEVLELDVSKQRLDSTHIESNMASFGRTRLMGVAIKNFLTQVKRHDVGSYNRLPKELRDRYEPSRHQLFGDWVKEDDWSRLRQTVAENMHYLVERYGRNKNHRDRSTYKSLVQIFHQQCEVQLDQVIIRKETGGDIVVNPSDPDATLDGHKGAGYQAQLSETCSPDNEVQLIVSAIPQTACTSDSSSLVEVIDDLKDHGQLPDELLADTSYGSDDNEQFCQAEGVELVSPTIGKCPEEQVDPKGITEADFVVEIQDRPNHKGEVVPTPVCTACPAGVEPHRSHYDHDTGQINILHFPETCGGCTHREKCPYRLASGWAQVTIDPKRCRLIKRRRRERTSEFRDRYKKRSGIEATNSLLKRVTGLGRLRVRGRPAVSSCILLKVAGWNILRAASVRHLRQKLVEMGLVSESAGFWCGVLAKLVGLVPLILPPLTARNATKRLTAQIRRL